jgi:ATP-binding cassette subfamily B protein
VHFHYAKSPHLALHNLSFSIEPGEILGIVGPSGSGKSTLVSLVFGFLSPTSGKVLIDGRDSCLIDPNSFREKLGVVPQEIVLFSGTIMENVAYGRPGASEEDVVEALKLAHAWDFVSSLKDQIYTKLADGGMRLSGGQKQRLALARALIRKPRVLLLDEATSAVDPETEKRLTETIKTLSPGRTIVIVSHRMESVKFCDKVLTLANGRVLSYDPKRPEGLPRSSRDHTESSVSSLSSTLRC